MPRINNNCYDSDLTAGQKKEAQELAKTLDNKGAFMGKNYKQMKGKHEDKGELRGRDGLRVVFDLATKSILRVFKKKGHETTDFYL